MQREYTSSSALSTYLPLIPLSGYPQPRSEVVMRYTSESDIMNEYDCCTYAREGRQSVGQPVGLWAVGCGLWVVGGCGLWTVGADSEAKVRHDTQSLTHSLSLIVTHCHSLTRSLSLTVTHSMISPLTHSHCVSDLTFYR